MKLQTLQTLQIFLVQDHGRWCVGAHIQAFTFSSQDHGRLLAVHVSKHSCACVQCVCVVVSVVVVMFACNVVCDMCGV